MSDIVEQLQGVAVHLDNHNNEWASRIAWKAVEEIERLQELLKMSSDAGFDMAKDVAMKKEAEIERLRAAVEDAIETLEAMDLHVDNPLYERLRTALAGKP